MDWKQIREMGVLLGHAVAKRMPRELPDDDLEVLRLAIDAREEERMATGREPCHQPFSWPGNIGLVYYLGSWTEARRLHDNSWNLKLVDDFDPEVVADYYGIPNKWGQYDWVDEPVARLFVWLGDALPENHYSGKAYRRLADEWPYDGALME